MRHLSNSLLKSESQNQFLKNQTGICETESLAKSIVAIFDMAEMLPGNPYHNTRRFQKNPYLISLASSRSDESNVSSHEITAPPVLYPSKHSYPCFEGIKEMTFTLTYMKESNKYAA